MTRSLHLPSAALLCGAALVASAAAPAPPARAASSTPDQAGFTVAPVDRSSLRFDARPGRTIAGRVRVQNLDSRPRTIRLTPSDLVTADTGGPSFPAKRPARAGTWLTIDRSLVRLPARGARTVAFRAKLPAAATTGQHFAGIVAVDTSDAAAARAPAKKSRGVSVRHLTRLALPVRLTAPGALTTHLALTDLKFGVDASGPSLRVGLRNDGNRIVRTTAIDLQVSRGGRRLLVVDEDVRDFITDSAISFPAAWRGRLERGTYRVTGVIRPKGGPPIRVGQDVRFGSGEADRLERKVGPAAVVPASAMPAWVWVALAVGALLLIALTIAVVRLMRRNRPAA